MAKGFTLVELLITIAIMATMAALILPSYGNFGRSQNLSDSAAQLETVLRQTQNKALSGTVCAKGIPASRWEVKINLNSSTYSVVPGGCDDPNHPTPTLTPTTVNYSYLGDVRASAVNTISLINSICTPTSSLTVSFDDISGDVSFYADDTLCSNISRADISLSDSVQTTIVSVGKGGSIYLNSTAPTPTP